MPFNIRNGFIKFLLCINYEKHLQNPSKGSILSNYPLEQVIHVGGSVMMIYPESYEIIQNYNGQTIIMKILGPSPAHISDQVSILEVLGSSNYKSAENPCAFFVEMGI